MCVVTHRSLTLFLSLVPCALFINSNARTCRSSFYVNVYAHFMYGPLMHPVNVLFVYVNSGLLCVLIRIQIQMIRHTRQKNESTSKICSPWMKDVSPMLVHKRYIFYVWKRRNVLMKFPLCVNFVFVSSRGIWMAENLVGLLWGKGLRVIMVNKAHNKAFIMKRIEKKSLLEEVTGNNWVFFIN